MNLKQILKIVILFIFLISLIFSFSIHYSLKNYQTALSKTNLANEIVLTVFQRKLLGDEYLAYPSERSAEQWFIKQNELKSKIDKNYHAINSNDEVDFTKKIKQGLLDSEAVFVQIVDLSRELEATISPNLLEKKSRLSTQLAIKAQETITAASSLAEINKAKLKVDLDQVVLLFSAAASLFFLMLFISFVVIWKSAKKVEDGDTRFNFVSNATHDAIYDWNILTNQVWFNKSMQTLFNYSPDQIEQTLSWYQDHIHPDDMQIINSDIEKILKGTNNSSLTEYRFRKADGSYANIYDRGFVVRDSKGKPLRLIGVMQDITDRKKYEENLTISNEKLKSLEKLKDEFVSLASHELRTPMGAIRSLTSTILGGDYGAVPENLKDPLNDINLSTERLINLVNNMLNISRIEAGRLKYEISNFDISLVAKEVCKTLAPLAKSQKIILDGSGVNKLKVSADIDNVKQILNNLIGNSLKFTEKGSIKLTSEKVGELAKIFIEDTGIGMKKEDQEKLFGKFQQISSAQAGKPQGSGLGLYLSKQLALKMGGDLRLESSEIGKGSIFSITLPLSGTELAQKVKDEIEKESKDQSDQKDLA